MVALLTDCASATRRTSSSVRRVVSSRVLIAANLFRATARSDGLTVSIDRCLFAGNSLTGIDNPPQMRRVLVASDHVKSSAKSRSFYGAAKNLKPINATDPRNRQCDG